MIFINYDELDTGQVQLLLTQHGLLVIRDAHELSIEQFSTLASSFGKPLVTDRHILNEDRTVQKLSENGLFGIDDVDWHNDWSYGRGNYFGTALYGVENAAASPTWFCDMTEVPNDLKDLYRNEIGHYYPPKHLHDSCFNERQLRLLEKQKVQRPFVFKHPRNGQEVLYCSPGTIQDNDVDLMPVIDWAHQNEYEHSWKDGDILIWDNLRMMHRRSAFEGHRLLWRVQFQFG